MRAVSVDEGELWAAIADGIGESDIVAELRRREGLLAPCAVLLPRSEAAAVEQAVTALSAAFAAPGFAAQALETAGGSHLPDFGQSGWILGFDFHLTPEGPRLIEINTNPGGMLVVAAQARALADLRPALGDPPEVEAEIVAAFRDEWRLCRGDRPLRRVAIVDDDPANQYLLPEFRLYRRLLEAEGIAAEIVDAGAFAPGWADMVYNRLVDLDLSSPAHTALAEAWRTGGAVVTPDPRSHVLYSDKRVLGLLRDGAAAAVPETMPLTEADAARLWADRRNWFFKPARGHAGKAVYRGAKITTSAWAGVLTSPYVAQRLIPPSRLHLDHLGTDLKMDVRANARNGRVIQLAARLYQGQTTNFRTAGGGFAPIFTC